jgi:hypothetical protein
VLDSVAWAAERIVVDMESMDETRDRRARGARVIGIAPTPRRRRTYGRPRRSPPRVDLRARRRRIPADDADAAVQTLVRAHGAAADAFAIPRFNAVAGRICTALAGIRSPDPLVSPGCVR